MSRNIILLSDGTGNPGGKARGTNVWAVYQALDRSAGPGEGRQIAFYDGGVGTSGFLPLKTLGGAFGLGLKRNVCQLYAELCRAYEPGDHVYLLGFSRGAYTVRLLAGLVGLRGIINPRNLEGGEVDADAARTEYQAFRAALRGESVQRSQLAHPAPTQGPIRFLGVWDTVDAVGLPWDGFARLVDQLYSLRFPDFVLGAYVTQAAHALSLDDERRTFHPNPFDLSAETDPNRVQQVWFPGVHTDVGGGYDKDQAAYVVLRWMVTRAERAGLRFSPTVRRFMTDQADPLGKHHDSRAGAGLFYVFHPRDPHEPVGKRATLLSGFLNRMTPADPDIEVQAPCVHVSVFERIHAGTAGYAPRWLGLPLAVVDDDGPLTELQEILHATAPVRGTSSRQVPPHARRVRALDAYRSWIHLAFLAASAALLCLTMSLYYDSPDHGWLPGRDALGVLRTWAVGNVFPPALGVTIFAVLLLARMKLMDQQRSLAWDAWADFRRADWPSRTVTSPPPTQAAETTATGEQA